MSRRRCGCEPPFGIYPPLAWILTFGGLASFQGLAVTYLFADADEEETRLIARVVPLCLAGAATLSFLHVSFADPSRRPAAEHGYGADDGGDPDAHTFGFCPKCDTNKLMKLNTKHCRLCNKCISHFDHHCVWLNTCIGARNNWSFMCLTFFIACEMGFSAYLCLKGIISRQDDMADAAWWGLSVFIFVENLLVGLLVGALFLFHCYLRLTGQTTYQWMMTRYYPGKNRFDIVKIRRRNAQKEMSKRVSGHVRRDEIDLSSGDEDEAEEEESAVGAALQVASGIGRLKDVCELVMEKADIDVPGKAGKGDRIRCTSSVVELKLGGDPHQTTPDV